MKTAVLLSGGLDSTTALHWAKCHHEVVVAFSFDYGSNHAVQELRCARWQAEALGVPYRELDLRAVFCGMQSSLLSGAEAIPTGEYAEENMKSTVVPFRNGIFLAIAAGMAESLGAEGVVIAAHSGDHAIYPDCRADFMQAMSEAIRLGTYAGLQIVDPFIGCDKAAIAAAGATLGVDFSHTYSCYKGGERHCGLCATCRERKDAFRLAGIPDPTEYEA